MTSRPLLLAFILCASWLSMESALAEIKSTSPAAEKIPSRDYVNPDDPNLARGSEFVADAASSCTGQSDISACLRAQGLIYDVEIKQALKMADPSQSDSASNSSAPVK